LELSIVLFFLFIIGQFSKTVIVLIHHRHKLLNLIHFMMVSVILKWNPEVLLGGDGGVCGLTK
jgi:hypothetical protein